MSSMRSTKDLIDIIKSQRKKEEKQRKRGYGNLNYL